MKTLLALLCFSCTFMSKAHSQTINGTYSNTWDNASGASLTYRLTLNANATFIFESYRIFEDGDLSKKVTVKGTWHQENRLLTLITEISDADNELANHLNTVKAKFEYYSPRHKDYGKVPPSLKFYQSEVFYAKGMTLKKVSDEVVTSSKTSSAETVVQNDVHD